MSAIAAARSLRASAFVGKRASPAPARKVAFVPRAAATSNGETVNSTTPEAAPITAAPENVVFYRGNSYTEEEYSKAKASGAINDLSAVEVPVYAEPPSFGGEERRQIASFFSSFSTVEESSA